MNAKTRKSSPSNMAERQPVTRKVKAMVSGATGHALASAIIAGAMAVGELIERQFVSRKDRLVELMALDKANIAEFMADLRAKQEEINNDAKAVPNRTLRDYMEDYPKAGSVYSETSMWLGIAKAVDAGWKPSNDKGEAIKDPAHWPEWRLLAMQATKARDSIGKPSKDGKNPELAQSSKRKRGRQPVAPQTKAVNAVKAALKDDKGQALPKNNRNLSQVIEGILADATVQELTEVAATVERMLKAATEAEKKMQEAVKNAADKAKGETKKEEKQNPDGSTTATTSNGATVTKRPASTGTIKAEAPSAADQLVAEGKRITATPPTRSRAKSHA